MAKIESGHQRITFDALFQTKDGQIYQPGIAVVPDEVAAEWKKANEPKTILLHEQYIHSGVWYGPGEVKVPARIASDLVTRQEEIMADRQKHGAKSFAGPALKVGVPDDLKTAEPNILRIGDVEKLASNAAAAAEKSANEENDKRKAELKNQSGTPLQQ